MAPSIILADGRWRGAHGIGRFAAEVLPRLQNTEILTNGPPPLSLQNLFWQGFALRQYQQQGAKVFFNPGFNPVFLTNIPVVLTIHDLIHLHYPGRAAFVKRWFYQQLIKPVARRAYRILTVSHYSKQAIIHWAQLPKDQVVVVGNGASAAFTPEGERYSPKFPYLLHVGNNAKPHKNIARLLKAFAKATIDQEIKLILTGEFSTDVYRLIEALGLVDRCLSRPGLSEVTLANYYRGALGLLLPSLYEGFGLPVIEAMACGTPVLTSEVTALPETAGDAALLINPYDENAISAGIAQLVNDEIKRREWIERGYERAKQCCWDKVAAAIQTVLDQVL